jgi:response regulator NasT
VEREASRNFGGAPRRVVVAEDDAEMRRILVETLTSEGCEVLAVADGGDLLVELAQSNRHNFDVVDLIVTDMRMPRCSGLQAAAAIRAIRPRVKILLVTAFAEESTYARAKSIGVTVLEKPFSMDRLREVTRSLLAP